MHKEFYRTSNAGGLTQEVKVAGELLLQLQPKITVRVVLSYARAFLVGRDPGTADYLDADVRNPEFILERAAETLDFSKPVGFLLLAILQAIPEAEDPHWIVATLVDALLKAAISPSRTGSR